MKIAEAEHTMWRYADHLLLKDSSKRISLGEGWTPLIEASGVAKEMGCGRLLVKDESQNPSGTFKDRSAAYTMSLLSEKGVKGVVLNSTGNASASFALYAARVGIACISVVPKDVLPENLLQMRLLGTEIHQPDDWSTAKAMSAQLAIERGFTDVSAANAPSRSHAKMTLGFEIAEQLDWRLPDAMVVPTGGGIAILAVHAAFKQLLESGTARGALPRLIASQFDGCSPIARAFEAGENAVKPWGPISTPRGGMRTPNPPLGAKVLEAVGSGGAFASAPAAASEEVLNIAQRDGVLVGLETGTALHALRQAIKRGTVGQESTVVVLNTSTVLKSDANVLPRK